MLSSGVSLLTLSQALVLLWAALADPCRTSHHHHADRESPLQGPQVLSLVISRTHSIDNIEGTAKNVPERKTRSVSQFDDTFNKGRAVFKTLFQESQGHFDRGKEGTLPEAAASGPNAEERYQPSENATDESPDPAMQAQAWAVVQRQERATQRTQQRSPSGKEIPGSVNISSHEGLSLSNLTVSTSSENLKPNAHAKSLEAAANSSVPIDVPVGASLNSSAPIDVPVGASLNSSAPIDTPAAPSLNDELRTVQRGDNFSIPLLKTGSASSTSADRASSTPLLSSVTKSAHKSPGPQESDKLQDRTVDREEFLAPDFETLRAQSKEQKQNNQTKNLKCIPQEQSVKTIQPEIKDSETYNGRAKNETAKQIPCGVLNSSLEAKFDQDNTTDTSIKDKFSLGNLIRFKKVKSSKEALSSTKHKKRTKNLLLDAHLTTTAAPEKSAASTTPAARQVLGSNTTLPLKHQYSKVVHHELLPGAGGHHHHQTLSRSHNERRGGLAKKGHVSDKGHEAISKAHNAHFGKEGFFDKGGEFNKGKKFYEDFHSHYKDAEKASKGFRKGFKKEHRKGHRDKTYSDKIHHQAYGFKKKFDEEDEFWQHFSERGFSGAQQSLGADRAFHFHKH